MLLPKKHPVEGATAMRLPKDRNDRVMVGMGSVLAGLAVAVGDALDEVKAAAHYVTKCDGGRGAVREVIDLCLAAKK